MFRHILAALSGTREDASLLLYAEMLNGLFPDAVLRCVHVGSGGAPESSDLPPDCEIVSGDRTDAVVEAALRHRTDLILLGHRNTGRPRRSLARRLAMTAPCSVWMVPNDSPPMIRSVLAPVDFSERSGDSLSAATEIASRAGLEECTALHVDFNLAITTEDEVNIRQSDDREKSFSIFTARIPLHDIDVRPLFIDCPDVARSILQTAANLQTDLIVMNTRGRSRSAAVLLGSETEAVLIGAHSPVLAVKHYGSRMRFLEALLDKRIRDRRDLHFA